MADLLAVSYGLFICDFTWLLYSWYQMAPLLVISSTLPYVSLLMVSCDVSTYVTSLLCVWYHMVSLHRISYSSFTRDIRWLLYLRHHTAAACPWMHAFLAIRSCKTAFGIPRTRLDRGMFSHALFWPACCLPSLACCAYVGDALRYIRCTNMNSFFGSTCVCLALCCSGVALHWTKLLVVALGL